MACWKPAGGLPCSVAMDLGRVFVRVPDSVIGVVQISRYEFECVGMGGANDGEVPSVECGDLGDSQPFGCCHDRTVDGSQRQVPILTHQFGDAEPVACHDRLDGEFARREITQEADLGFGAKPCSDEVGHLGDHEYRHDQWTGMLQQELERFGVVPVVGVDVGIERPGVDEEGYRATSAERISSMRSEMSSRPLRPAPAARRRRWRPPR
jgi:hypothetical protein